MNNKFANKNLLFYKNTDNLSDKFIQLLNKNVPLKKQFILINCSDPSITLPKHLVNIQVYPILIAQGVHSPITGESALAWILNSGFTDKGNGLEFVNLTSRNMGSLIGCENNSESLLNNNGIIENGGGGENLCYSYLNEKTENLNTFKDSESSKKEILSKKLDKLKSERELDTKQFQPDQRTMKFDNNLFDRNR